MSDLLRRRAMMQQSRGKTMQLLAEYTVTEPAREFTIPITEQMRSCGTLYVMMNLTATATDYLYVGLNNKFSWYSQKTNWVDNFQIVRADAKSIGEVQFPEKWVALTATNTTIPVTTATLTYLQFYMYKTSTNITAGTVKIYGEV